MHELFSKDASQLELKDIHPALHRINKLLLNLDEQPSLLNCLSKFLLSHYTGKEEKNVKLIEGMGYEYHDTYLIQWIRNALYAQTRQGHQVLVYALPQKRFRSLQSLILASFQTNLLPLAGICFSSGVFTLTLFHDNYNLPSLFFSMSKRQILTSHMCKCSL